MRNIELGKEIAYINLKNKVNNTCVIQTVIIYINKRRKYMLHPVGGMFVEAESSGNDICTD